MTRRLQEWHKLHYSDSIAGYNIKKLRAFASAGKGGGGVNWQLSPPHKFKKK
jgi:hypothetical protein